MTGKTQKHIKRSEFIKSAFSQRYCLLKNSTTSLVWNKNTPDEGMNQNEIIWAGACMKIFFVFLISFQLSFVGEEEEPTGHILDTLIRDEKNQLLRDPAFYSKLLGRQGGSTSLRISDFVATQAVTGV